MLESSDSNFGASARRRMVEDFVVACYNGSLKPNFAEKNPTTGRDVEYLMDGPQFDRIRKAEIWSYSNAIGTGYQYRVVYRDRRFSDLERLMEVYSGTVQSPDEDRERTEQSLYQVILLLIKEGRLPKTFKLQTSDQAQEQKVVALVEELSRSMEELGRRVRVIEEQLAAQQALQVQSPATPVPESTPSV
ncbi:MAG TPA: hypothetical protein VJR06_00510 [Nitrososphaerales archaeon]|nr:hypothetical protein [Nitrososphaerales archaeon]